jgi:hypothetical protein
MVTNRHQMDTKKATDKQLKKKRPKRDNEPFEKPDFPLDPITKEEFENALKKAARKMPPEEE